MTSQLPTITNWTYIFNQVINMLTILGVIWVVLLGIFIVLASFHEISRKIRCFTSRNRLKPDKTIKYWALREDFMNDRPRSAFVQLHTQDNDIMCVNPFKVIYFTTSTLYDIPGGTIIRLDTASQSEVFVKEPPEDVDRLISEHLMPVAVVESPLMRDQSYLEKE